MASSDGVQQLREEMNGKLQQLREEIGMMQTTTNVNIEAAKNEIAKELVTKGEDMLDNVRKETANAKNDIDQLRMDCKVLQDGLRDYTSKLEAALSNFELQIATKMNGVDNDLMFQNNKTEKLCDDVKMVTAEIDKRVASLEGQLALARLVDMEGHGT